MIEKIALTGGIGSGKSTAAKYFAELGVPVIDADVIAHELTKPNTPAFKKITAHFGSANRKTLREIVFKNPKERLWLEKLLHPLICKKMQKQAANLKAPYCILVIPLLFEAKIRPKIDRILVIDSSKTMQLKRTLKRDGTKKSTVKAIINSQIDRQTRLKQADDVVKNNGSLAALKQKITKLHKQYLKPA